MKGYQRGREICSGKYLCSLFALYDGTWDLWINEMEMDIGEGIQCKSECQTVQNASAPKPLVLENIPFLLKCS
jgi:hypothetical protein